MKPNSPNLIVRSPVALASSRRQIASREGQDEILTHHSDTHEKDPTYRAGDCTRAGVGEEEGRVVTGSGRKGEWALAGYIYFLAHWIANSFGDLLVLSLQPLL
jgi:hypothetical protein